MQAGFVLQAITLSETAEDLGGGRRQPEPARTQPEYGQKPPAGQLASKFSLPMKFKILEANTKNKKTKKKSKNKEGKQTATVAQLN